MWPLKHDTDIVGQKNGVSLLIISLEMKQKLMFESFLHMCAYGFDDKICSYCLLDLLIEFTLYKHDIVCLHPMCRKMFSCIRLQFVATS